MPSNKWASERKRDFKELTVIEAVLAIGKLGGFLGRNSNGYPGMKSIWKGWKILYERIEFLREMRYG